MEPSEFDNSYDRAAEKLLDLGRTLESLIGEILAANGFAVHSVTHRVKKKDSAARKLSSLSRGSSSTALGSLTDLLGVRVITYFRDEVDKVARVVEDEFHIDRENSVDKRATLDPDRFGYLSLHYVASLNVSRAALAEYRRFKGLVFELQIRSILQHAWAEIEHDLGYKSEQAVPKEVRRRFSRLAGLLELADDEFVGIRDLLSRHREETEAEVGKGVMDIEIDQDSVYALIATSSALKELDHYIAQSVGRPELGSTDRTYAGMRAFELKQLGFQTIGDVLTAITAGGQELKEFARRWVNDDYRHEIDDEDFENAFGGEDDFDEEPDVSELDWPAGVGLYYVFLYHTAQSALNKFTPDGGFPRGMLISDRNLAACLAATRGERQLLDR